MYTLALTEAVAQNDIVGEHQQGSIYVRLLKWLDRKCCRREILHIVPVLGLRG